MLRKVLKIIAANIGILIGILLILDIVAITIYQGHSAIGNLMNKNDFYDGRDTLPNYKNTSWAYQHFKEINELRSEYESYIGWRRLPYSGKTITVDQDGLRTTRQSEFVTDESPVVVFLGGSTMFGSGSNDENTIPSLFSETSGGKYRAVNLGESSYREFQSYLMLMREINKGLKPDIIISYAGVNEVLGYKADLTPTAHAREAQIRVTMQGQDTRLSKEDYDLTFRNFFIGPIESLITKLKTKAYNLNHHNDNNYIVNNDRTRQVAKALLDSWSAMKMLADKNNALFVAALQPNVAIGHPNVKYLEIDSGFVEPYKYLYPEILRQINDTAYEDIKNNFIDLTAIFDVEDSLYIDWCHVIPEGNKIIAEKLLEYINNIVNN